MNKTHIYFIRHGESQANERDAFAGHIDLELTEKGRMQAQKTAEYLKDISVDVIYSSDLLRAYHTAEYTAKIKGMEIIKSENLREIFAGEWENKTFCELEKNYAVDYKVWLDNIGMAACTGGESVMDMSKRVIGEVENIVRENEGKTIFIFTHGTPIRVLRAFCEGKKDYEIKDIPWASNASVSYVQYENGTFTLKEYGIDDFLGNMATSFPDNV